MSTASTCCTRASSSEPRGPKGVDKGKVSGTHQTMHCIHALPVTSPLHKEMGNWQFTRACTPSRPARPRCARPYHAVTDLARPLPPFRAASTTTHDYACPRHGAQARRQRLFVSDTLGHLMHDAFEMVRGTCVVYGTRREGSASLRHSGWWGGLAFFLGTRGPACVRLTTWTEIRATRCWTGLFIMHDSVEDFCKAGHGAQFSRS
jgi:hypothetical protein